jgi:hypothetical protein
MTQLAAYIPFKAPFLNTLEDTMNSALLDQQLDLNNQRQEREWFYLGWTRSPAA